jgi:hypothetical protein
VRCNNPALINWFAGADAFCTALANLKASAVIPCAMAIPKTGSAAPLALQLLYLKASESMGNHDSKVVDADSVD